MHFTYTALCAYECIPRSTVPNQKKSGINCINESSENKNGTVWNCSEYAIYSIGLSMYHNIPFFHFNISFGILVLFLCIQIICSLNVILDLITMYNGIWKVAYIFSRYDNRGWYVIIYWLNYIINVCRIVLLNLGGVN